MKTHDPDQPLFSFLEFDFRDARDHASAIADIHANAINGIIVRSMFSEDEIATVVDRIGRDDPPMQRMPFPKSRHLPEPAMLLGHSVVVTTDMDQYFEDAARYRQKSRGLFRGFCDFETRMEELLGTLSGGLPVSVAPGIRPGQTYTPATGRLLPRGHGMKVHVGNSFLELPQARHLSSIVDIECQLSYFLTLTAPESGGELVVYSLEWTDTLANFGSATAALAAYDATLVGEASAHVQTFESMSFKPRPGDILIFDGGRYYHKVSDPESGPRWTIGGFLAYSRDRTHIHYWS